MNHYTAQRAPTQFREAGGIRFAEEDHSAHACGERQQSRCAVPNTQSCWLRTSRSPEGRSISRRGDQNMKKKQVELPGPEHPISIERNPSRVVVSVAGRVVADTRNALTLREAAYPAVQYIPGEDVDFSQLERVDPPPGTLSRSGCG